MRQKYKQPQRQKAQYINPFSKSNPYRVKAKFHSSQNKQPKSRIYQSIGTPTSNSLTNAQLLYSRNYKEVPPVFHKDNFMALVYNKQGASIQQSDLDYKLQLKQHMAEQFCAADPYLSVIKDNVAYFSGDRSSQFINVMRISNFQSQTGAKRYGQEKIRSQSKFSKENNPFHRKNLLIAGQSDYESTNVSFCTSSYSHYPDNMSPTPQSCMTPNIYDWYMSQQQSYPTANEPKASQQPYVPEYNNAPDPHSSPKSVESFGPKQKWQIGRKGRDFIDGIIQRPIDGEEAEIQGNAPKSVTIKGRKFGLQKVYKRPGTGNHGQ